MTKIDKVFKSVSEAISLISAVIVLLSATLLFVHSCMRYIFHFTVRWADELGSYSVVISVFLMLAVLDYDDCALSIDFIYGKMKGGSVGKKILDVIRWIASMFINCMLIYSGYRVVKQALAYNSVNVATKIPYSFIFGLMLFGIILAFLYKLCIPFITAGRKEIKDI